MTLLSNQTGTRKKTEINPFKFYDSLQASIDILESKPIWFVKRNWSMIKNRIENYDCRLRSVISLCPIRFFTRNKFKELKNSFMKTFFRWRKQTQTMADFDFMLWQRYRTTYHHHILCLIACADDLQTNAYANNSLIIYVLCYTEKKSIVGCQCNENNSDLKLHLIKGHWNAVLSKFKTFWTMSSSTQSK